ncbi:unnamed protein product, partial [Cyprideis torosa]
MLARFSSRNEALESAVLKAFKRYIDDITGDDEEEEPFESLLYVSGKVADLTNNLFFERLTFLLRSDNDYGLQERHTSDSEDVWTTLLAIFLTLFCLVVTCAVGICVIYVFSEKDEEDEASAEATRVALSRSQGPPVENTDRRRSSHLTGFFVKYMNAPLFHKELIMKAVRGSFGISDKDTATESMDLVSKEVKGSLTISEEDTSQSEETIRGSLSVSKQDTVPKKPKKIKEAIRGSLSISETDTVARKSKAAMERRGGGRTGYFVKAYEDSETRPWAPQRLIPKTESSSDFANDETSSSPSPKSMNPMSEAQLPMIKRYITTPSPPPRQEKSKARDFVVVEIPAMISEMPRPTKDEQQSINGQSDPAFPTKRLTNETNVESGTPLTSSPPGNVHPFDSKDEQNTEAVEWSANNSCTSSIILERFEALHEKVNGMVKAGDADFQNFNPQTNEKQLDHESLTPQISTNEKANLFNQRLTKETSDISMKPQKLPSKQSKSSTRRSLSQSLADFLEERLESNKRLESEESSTSLQRRRSEKIPRFPPNRVDCGKLESPAVPILGVSKVLRMSCEPESLRGTFETMTFESRENSEDFRRTIAFEKMQAPCKSDKSEAGRVVKIPENSKPSTFQNADGNRESEILGIPRECMEWQKTSESRESESPTKSKELQQYQESEKLQSSNKSKNSPKPSVASERLESPIESNLLQACTVTRRRPRNSSTAASAPTSTAA